MSNIIPVKKLRVANNPRTRSETLFVTPETMKGWLKPPCQRDVKITRRLHDVAADIKGNGGEITGTIILGELANKPGVFYLIDGQHRREAAYLSGLTEFLVEIRIHTFDTIGEMGDEFVKLNSVISRMVPDDILRGMEGATPALQAIRRACPFIGYGNIRRNENSQVLSMSVAIKSWSASCNETPAPNSGIGSAAMDLVQKMENVDEMIRYLQTVHSAWQGVENARLWGSLNLSLVGWLWQRLVVDTVRKGNQRSVVLKPDQFKRCCMSLSSSTDYTDWLVGRSLTPRHRSPAYKRIRDIFAKRLREDDVQRARLPQPEWVAN